MYAHVKAAIAISQKLRGKSLHSHEIYEYKGNGVWNFVYFNFISIFKIV